MCPSAVARRAACLGAMALSGAAPAARREAPELVRLVQAGYTGEALAAGIRGPVFLRAGIDQRGVRAVILRGLGWGLDQKAGEAVGKGRFKPGLRNGVPARMWIPIEVVYRPKLPQVDQLQGRAVFPGRWSACRAERHMALSLAQPFEPPLVFLV